MTTSYRSYGVNGKLIALGPSTYSYSSTQDNGQITTRVSTGETIVYQYDALNRLTQASASGTTWAPWTQQFQYDGFGNLTAKTLNGVTTSIPVDPATNRLVSSYYDANGNMTSGAGASMTYDESNRLDSVTPISGGTEYYTYAPDNKRIGILKADNYTEEWTLYGVRGERIGVYSLGTLSSGGGTYYWSFTRIEKDVWFAGHLIWQYRPGYSVSGITGSVEEDRNGTDLSALARFLPYGEEITSTANDRMKFATYTRDSFTALDCADQRYYAASYGRFNTADQYMASAGPKDPGSWNRYAYVGGDPVNQNDPTGQMAKGVDGYCSAEYRSCDDEGGSSYSAGGIDPQCTQSRPTDYLDPVLGLMSTMNCYGYGLGSVVFLTATASTQTVPTCDVDLLSQAVGPSIDPFNHTLLKVTLSNGQTDYLEGIPSPKNPAQSNVVTDPMWLNASDKTTGPYYSNSTSAVQSWLETDSLCDKLIKLVDNGFANNTITYNNSWPWDGPNSNSFTHSLLDTVGLSVYGGLSNFLYPGWSNTSVPFGN
jgi:RHS repeat-associated protein